MSRVKSLKVSDEIQERGYKIATLNQILEQIQDGNWSLIHKLNPNIQNESPPVTAALDNGKLVTIRIERNDDGYSTSRLIVDLHPSGQDLNSRVVQQKLRTSRRD